MTITTEMTIGGKSQWRVLICPMSSRASSSLLCGEECAWYSEEERNVPVGHHSGKPVVTVALCKGKLLGKFVVEEEP
jgi:hypothetical protein